MAAGGHFPSWQELADTTESKPGPPNILTHTHTQRYSRKLHTLSSLPHDCYEPQYYKKNIQAGVQTTTTLQLANQKHNRQPPIVTNQGTPDNKYRDNN